VISFAQSASINFISPAKIGEKVTAHAQEEASEGRTGVYTVKVTAEDGRTIAVFQGLSRTAGGKVVEE
jgi:acyl-CoA thioesterase